MVTIYKEDGSSEDSEDIRNNMKAQQKQEAKEKPLSFSNLSKQLSGLLSTKPSPQQNMKQKYLNQLRNQEMMKKAKIQAEAQFQKEQARRPENRKARREERIKQEKLDKIAAFEYNFPEEKLKRVMNKYTERYDKTIGIAEGVAKGIIKEATSAAAGARKYEKSLDRSRRLSQGFKNFIFPSTNVKANNKEQMRQIKAELAFLRLQKMKMKMLPQRGYRRIRNYKPPQLRNYYAQMEAQNSHSLGTKSSRTGGSASGSSTMYNSERLPSDFIIEPSFFNSNVKQIRPRTWSQHREKFTNYDTTQSRFNRKDKWLIDAENRVRDGW